MIGAINRYAINSGASPDWVQRAAAVAVAAALAYPVQAKVVKVGAATAYATATAVLALAFANQEVSAPDARTMIVQPELHEMIVPLEDRLMRVFA